MAAKPKKGKPTASISAPIPLKLAHRKSKAAMSRVTGYGAWLKR